MKNIIVKGYDISKQNLKGMTPDQYIKLMEFQNFSCPLSGKKFEHSRELKKFLDVEGRVTNVQAPPVDHDHETGFFAIFGRASGQKLEMLSLCSQTLKFQVHNQVGCKRSLPDSLGVTA